MPNTFIQRVTLATITPPWADHICGPKDIPSLTALQLNRQRKAKGYDVPDDKNVCPNCGHIADHEACNGRIE